MKIKKIVIIVKQEDEEMDWTNLREDLITTVEYHKLSPFTIAIIENPGKCEKGVI